MNEPRYVRLLLGTVVLLAAGLYCLPVQGQTDARRDDMEFAEAVGRDNPFAALVQAKPVEPNNITGPAPTVPDTLEQRPELFIETIALKFLDAKTLLSVLTNMSSEYGNIAVNAKTNSLTICDTRERLEKILGEIKKADKTPPQIMIEAVICEVQLDNDTEIGINWDILSDKLYDVSYRQKLGSRLKMVSATSDNLAETTAFDTISDTGIEGGYFALISGTIRHTVHLLQEKKNVEILASPRVMVVSGSSASIETVTELPYREVTETSAGGSLSSTDFKLVGVKLNVTPVVTEEGDILVTVQPEQSVNTGQFGTTSEIPIIDTRKAKTTLLLKDGQVVVVGGLRRKEITDQVNQVPILGDLPLVGALFRNTEKSVTTSELLVFLSPHIYKGQPPTEEEMEKFDRATQASLITTTDQKPGEEAKPKDLFSRVAESPLKPAAAPRR